ncbi:NAD(P)H-dependent flavin oxidoreductase [Vibrio cionasavignyae]|uniref:NAD(P)H-dependent flavin oxidoreductase n=1 Tax=Vibrio cionasavignyae TaxID=2910252 RepID=UPI003D0CBC64
MHKKINNADKVKALIGTDLPIIQAPMAGVQDHRLTVAVSQAGGLGSLPCGMLDIDTIVNEIKAIKGKTSYPFNLNFFCHNMPNYDVEKHNKWQRVLTPFFNELDIDSNTLTTSTSRTPFNHSIADAIEPFAPAVISFHFGLPSPELVSRIKNWGSKILSTATTVQEAIWLESNGADAIIVQGVEAGGHRGMFLSEDLSSQTGLMALLPQVIAQVNVPVIAAGGISDQCGVEAALILGASAVQVGTAYLLCPEASTSQLHRDAIKANRTQSNTAITNLFTGRPARGIVNRVMQELGYINNHVPDFPYASIEMSQLRTKSEKLASSDFSPLWCGQNTMGCAEISAKDLTLHLVNQR